MSSLHSIIPPHEPIGLAQDMREKVEQNTIVAGFYVLLTEDDELIYDGAAYHKKDLLWALHRTIKDLIDG